MNRLQLARRSNIIQYFELILARGYTPVVENQVNSKKTATPFVEVSQFLFSPSLSSCVSYCCPLPPKIN
jgi:hypothetical protein